jgi:hypothetical protein
VTVGSSRTLVRGTRSLAFGALGAVLVAVLLVLVVGSFDLLKNPFSREQVDRSGPALLERLEDLAEYRAASAQLQVLVDVEEDVRFVPSIVAGERTTFLAFGNVDAVVDFDALDPDDVEVSEDRRSVRLTLPSARIGDVDVDPERSYVINRRRGVLDRIGSVFTDSPTGERELYLLSRDKLRAAADESEVTERAETNTRRMLTALFESLGFTDVQIAFEDDVRS